MKVDFICGCQTKEILSRENIKTMDMVTFDDEGFLVCAVHHQRRYGWRSIPNVRGTKLMDYFFKDWTALEIEAWQVFGETAPVSKTVEINTTGLVDRRDNRDPQTLVASARYIRRGDRVFTAPEGEHFWIVPRDTEPLYDHELQIALDERSGTRGGSKVLPWPSHVRDHEASSLRERVRKLTQERDSTD